MPQTTKSPNTINTVELQFQAQYNLCLVMVSSYKTAQMYLTLITHRIHYFQSGFKVTAVYLLLSNSFASKTIWGIMKINI